MGRSRATVTVTVTLPQLEVRAGVCGTLEWSGPVPAPTLEQLVCEADLEWLITNPAGTPLNYGQTTQFANRAQRRAPGGCHVRDGD